MFATQSWRTPTRAKIVTILGLVCLSLVVVSISEAQDKGAPPWGEFLRRFNKDRLLKPPFHQAEETTPKGLASKIRARELDVPNRIAAINYLAELDCSQFPEARDMLILAMQEDEWERVRYAAARGLRDMLARNACGNSGENGNCQTGQCNTASTSVWDHCVAACKSAAGKVKPRRGEKRGETAEDCRCKNCCDEDTLNALAKTAYEMDEKGCPVEPSLRVREMAVEAISACGIPCHYKPYYANSEETVPVPAVEEKTFNPDQPQETPKADDAVPQPEATPEKEGAEGGAKEAKLPPLPRVTSTQPAVKTTVQPTPIEQLDKICIVSWRNGEKLQPSQEFESVHKGRLYHFANAEAKALFDASPEDYAVAYGGCDPVHYLKTKEPVVGRYLADCDGKFYLFATIENLEEFNSRPEVFSAGESKSVRVASNETSN